MSEGIQIVGTSYLWRLYLGMLAAKNYRPVRRPNMDSNLNHRVVEHHRKCGLFSDLHHGFRSSRPILDLLTVVFDRITTAFDRSVT